jgi:hypothetical protein
MLANEANPVFLAAPVPSGHGFNQGVIYQVIEPVIKIIEPSHKKIERSSR